MRAVSLGMVCRGGIGLLCLGALLSPASGQDPLPDVRTPAPPISRNRIQGAGSCSAIACHGSAAAVPNGESGVRRNEHTTWIADDPHSLAFQALFSERSERMVRKLAGRSATVTPAHQDERCLACHTTPRGRRELKQTALLNQDGVGCESCHGAAEKWLGPHTTAWWNELPPEAKESRYGLRRTRDLAHRAKVCTECHVGGHASPDGAIARDVNHDLIAAGHPRLNFEFAAYLDNLPPHWSEKGRNASPDFPALAWTVGQVATTHAALELLRDRARAGGPAWPEFSEYGCFSCHHELADEPWRRDRSLTDPAIPAGSPRWGSWYLPMNEALAADDRAAGLDPDGEWAQFEAAIRRLVGEMSKPIPRPATVEEIADSALGPLGRRLDAAASRTFSAPDAERILASFNDADSWRRVGSWDHAAQRYLAIVPFRQAWINLAPGHAGQEKLKADLDALRTRLRFDTTLDGPRRGFVPNTLRDSR